jgi:hypothetical protein
MISRPSISTWPISNGRGAPRESGATRRTLLGASTTLSPRHGSAQVELITALLCFGSAATAILRHQFRVTAPSAEWNGVWSLVLK